MSIHTLAGVLCAVGMFLFGIDIMGDGLKKACGEKMKNILSACTKNRLTGVLTGFAVTGILQSSCAVTVMAVSFVDCGLMSFSQAVGIIMGANIGTTVTSLLLAFNFSAIAPICVFAGTVLKLFCKKEKLQNIGLVFAGFGLLFVAMSNMNEYMLFFKRSEAAQSFLLHSSGRLSCLLFGFAITAIMQSSSATVGVLQSAAASGLLTTKSALYILFGQNIGAVVPTLFSSVKAGRQAKKAAVMHFLFNVFGTVIFILITEALPYVRLLEAIENGSMRVSVSHIVFNCVSTAVLLPLAPQMEKCAELMVPCGKEENKEKKFCLNN